MEGGSIMSYEVMVDGEALREQVREKYKEVAVDPHREYHFHTGRFLAAHLGYDKAVVDALPDVAVESFAGVANPFSLQALGQGERVVDVGSGGGFDSFIALAQVGQEGEVVGVDMRCSISHDRPPGALAMSTLSSARDSPRPCRLKTAGQTS
jgi:protein-L-isoaspartate O-methyltransferase